MLSKKLLSVVPFAGVFAASLCWAPVAFSGSPSSDAEKAQYKPVQSISYEFGSKSMSGYFVQQDTICLVMLMVAEKGHPEQDLPPSPTRVRLMLTPGQVAGLDSEEGKSLNFTCGEDAATLLVQQGDSDRLIALQTRPTVRSLAERH
jgi:hypothetical protein